MKYEINNSSQSVSTSPFLYYSKSNLKSNQSTPTGCSNNNIYNNNNNTNNINRPKEFNCAMTNEETRCLTGVVAKTRALFESNQCCTTNFSTPQNVKTKMNFKTFSAVQVPKIKTSISIAVENESDNKENFTHHNRVIKSENLIKPILRNKDDYSKVKLTEPRAESSTLIKKSYSSNRISTFLDEPETAKSRGRLNSANIVINKSEEISKEFNIPMSVKQAKACFESLAQNSQNSNQSPKQAVPKFTSINKSKSPNSYTPVKASILKTDTCKNIILIPEMMNSLTTSSSSTSSDMSVFNTSSGSSCETTPRIGEKKIINKTSKVADRIKKLEELKSNEDSEHNSVLSSSSSINSILNNQTSPIVKYSQSSKFIQLYQKQMEVNTNSYRKLEDIINEADQSLAQKINVVQENKEEKKLKSILRKGPKYEPFVTSEIKIETKSTVRSPSCSSSSPSCSPSSSMSSLTKPVEQKTDLAQVKIDDSSCVVPSKMRQRTHSLDNTNPQEPCPIVNNLNKMNNSFTSGIIKTPSRNIGSYIKNSTYSAGNSNSELVKRVTRNATNAREALIRWCRKMTEEYDNVSINNFSSSWSDGLAFCALLHHFMPNEFDYSNLTPTNPRYNFDLAFKTAEDKAGILSLLDVDDMIEMGDSPDWKCVFTYVHSIYQRFKDNC